MTEISSKPDSSHIEKSEAAFSSYEEKSLSTEQESALAEFPDLLDDSRDSDIVRKVDRNVLPWLALLYAWSLIDRTNMGNAQLEGMSAELKLFVENRYSICLLVFFPTYFIVELPATLVIRRIAPRYVITFIAVTWGLCMVGMGFVKKWGGLAALRALLGVLEGGYYPICVYLISSWYKRFELQKRLTFFYAFGVIAAGLASILSYGLARIGPLGRYRPWSMIFFFEGAFTVIIGVIAFFFIVEFPHVKKRRFLTPRDHARQLYRLECDRDDLEHDPLTMKKLGLYLTEPLGWIYMFVAMCSTVTAYALTFFLPTILFFRLKFTLVKAQCLASPPFIFAVVVAGIGAYISDRYKIRAPVIVANAGLTMIGLGLLYAKGLSPAVQYFAVFLIAAGSNANIPAVMTYVMNNCHTSSRRAVRSAQFVGGGALGGIAGSLVFRQVDAPGYGPGLAACLVCNAFIILITGALTVFFRSENKKQDEGNIIAGKQGFRYAI